MKRFSVTGMSCAACSARVEKAVTSVKGVTSCAVNLLTNSMGVEGSADAEEIISAVVSAGYGACEIGKTPSKSNDDIKNNEQSGLLKRFLVSLVFLSVLMYCSMGHTMWGLPMPFSLAENHLAMGILQMLLTVAIMVINQRFFIGGTKALISGAPNMDSLIALGSSAAFGYSIYVLFAMTNAVLKADNTAAMEYMHELYFESAGMILTLITLGELLEARSKGKTTNALKALIELAPKTATVEREGTEKVIPAEQVKKGDVFLVRSGESIPVDGVVLEGSGNVNEAGLTGESVPVDKTVGDIVSAATINMSGFLRCEATRVGEDTTLAQIIKLVGDAAATKAPIAKVADRVSGIFVPAVLGIAVIAFLTWLAFGQTVGFALARAISVLVISCPCALGLATPVAIMVGNGVGAKHGILFKTAVALEQMGRTKIVVLDKTGTITVGAPHVTDIFPQSGLSDNKLLEYAATLEQYSEHPLSKAIMQEATERKIKINKATEFSIVTGKGLNALTPSGKLYGGNLDYISSITSVDSKSKEFSKKMAQAGKTPLFFCLENQFLGVIAVADVIKEESPAAISELKKMGVQVIMLTGDNKHTAESIGKQVGIDRVVSGVLPDGKEAVIRSLRGEGIVTMVGDGINDAPALTTADVGVAIGAGSDIAIDAADVVLMKNNLMDVLVAIRLSKATLRNIYQNLFWAFCYNIIGIPLAAGAFVSLLGWEMNPMFGAAAMSLSSFCVVSNALRLNLLRFGNKKSKENIFKNKKEENIMELTLKIEGMMCPHCEAHAKKALEGVDGVVSAVTSHTAGTAMLVLEHEVPMEMLKKAVEDCGYKVVG